MGPQKHYQKWSTGLYGQNAAKIEGRDSCCVNCFLYCILSHCLLCACLAKGKRKDLRHKYDLPHEPCGDFCVHCFCSPCSVCQEARELEFRAKMAPAQFVTNAPPQQVMMM
ncbi:hypothetical protein N2152v2_008374 [Parachlorella kessleri]